MTAMILGVQITLFPVLVLWLAMVPAGSLAGFRNSGDSIRISLKSQSFEVVAQRGMG